MRILIVDDNAAEAELLQKLLKRRFDADVFCCASMREARTQIAANHLDCIVVDLQLPDSGIEQTISTIRELPYPVFVYTGFDDPGLRERVLKSGAEDFILKATGNASIVERIAHLQFKRNPDPKLLQGAYAARHAEATRTLISEWKGTLPRILAALVTLISFAGGILLGGWGMAKTSGAREEETRQHFTRLDNVVMELKTAGEKRDNLISQLLEKATRSQDDRAAIREAMKDQNAMVIEWLKRIESKVDARK